MEQYLKEQYNVFEDIGYLNHESEIVDYFMDCGSDFLECGQGYYEDEISLIIKIGEKFYDVLIEAEIMSAKQDVGDRLYWVDRIYNVSYKEMDKPQPKPTMIVSYDLNITWEQKIALEKFMKDNYIIF